VLAGRGADEGVVDGTSGDPGRVKLAEQRGRRVRAEKPAVWEVGRE